jgi:hypothetical protein
MWKRWIAAFDVHGDMQDRDAVRVFFKFLQDHWKPHIRIMGGDLWDFRCIRNGASPEERADSVTADYQAGLEFLTRFKPNVFLRGNHDERLWEMSRRTTGDAMVTDYCLSGTLEVERAVRKMRCEMLPYHKRLGVYHLGHLHVVHGMRSGMYAAKHTCMDYGAPTLMGHIHSVDMWSAPGLQRRVGWSSGALCQLDMPYNERHVNTLRQNNGFAYGEVSEKTGEFSVNLAERINGEWSLNEKPIRLR